MQLPCGKCETLVFRYGTKVSQMTQLHEEEVITISDNRKQNKRHDCSLLKFYYPANTLTEGARNNSE
jgi:hypothetical protein